MSKPPAIEDEFSEPFFKGIAVAFVEVEGGDDDKCDLCAFASKNPVPPAGPTITKHDHRWGVLHDLTNNLCLCSETVEEEQHAFHLKCIRTFVHNRKNRYRVDPACPVCEKIIKSDPLCDPNNTSTAIVTKKDTTTNNNNNNNNSGGKGDAVDDGEDLSGEVEEAGQTGGKKRKREKMMFSCWVHVIQATGLKLKGSDRQMNPVAVVSAFGKTRTTPKGDHGKTYSCVWDTPFSFQKKMDIDELSKETIEIRIEDKKALWVNSLVGFIRFDAATVSKAPNHEFYRQWTPIVQVDSAKKDRALGTQGKLQVSVCVLSEEDTKADPKLPIHVYDLEVQMWKDMDQKKAVTDFDSNSTQYLSKKIEQKQEEDAHLITDLWDIIHVKVYRAEDLPKVDSGRGWCDGYVELEYQGLMNKNQKLKTKVVPKVSNPVWNHEFEIPIVNGAPIFFDRFDLILKDENKIEKDVLLGKCRFSISDILSLDKSTGPIWKNLYQDIDGKAPTYRGRILVEFSVETGVKDARVGSSTCLAVNEASVPKSTTYRLDVDIMEGLHLDGDYSEYQVDVALGHPMLGSDPRDIEKGGHAWVAFESVPRSKDQSKKCVPFNMRQSIMVHNLPLVPPQDYADDPSVSLDDARGGLGWTEAADRMPKKAEVKNFSTKTASSKSRDMLPDLMIYVSKKGSRSDCVGYLRIPLNSTKRPTENWEHGEDLTIFPGIFNGDNSARCLPLKPLVEMYEATCGFLLFRVAMTPVSGAETARLNNQLVRTPLEPVKRQKYKFVASVYQAKDVASVDESGLSSPFAVVQLMDLDLRSKPKMSTCFPQWMEALTGTVELPVNLNYAPDIAVTLYHYKPKSIFKHRDPSVFMGKAEIPARVASATGCPPAWYPLQFEELSYGDVLVSFRLAPEKDIPPYDVIQSGLTQMVDNWQTYAVDVSALTMRGSIATKFAKGSGGKSKYATYVLECWDNEIQTFSQQQAEKGKITVMVRKPENPVFYSSLNVRVFEDKELVAVASIPIDKILSTFVGWYRLLDVLTRTEAFLSSKIIRIWKAFVKRKRKPIVPGNINTNLNENVPLAGGTVDSSNPIPASPSLSQVKSSKFAKLRQAETSSDDQDIPLDTLRPVSSSLAEGSTSPERKGLVGPGATSSDQVVINIDEKENINAKVANKNMLQPRKVDENGNEVFEEQMLAQLVCDKVPDKDPGNPFEMHWKVDCEYELLPLTKNPFLEFDLNIGKDEIHQTFLEKLFVASKHTVGTLRGNFYAYPYGKSKKKESETSTGPSTPASNVFDGERYNDPSQYCVRVYVMRGLQLVSKKGRAEDCDSFVKVSLGEGGDEFKTEIKDSTLNPQFYKCFDFQKVGFPSVDTILNVQVLNDASMFGPDLIGETKVALENRLFSTQWWNGRKPIERRALFNSATGRLPQGFIEVCIDIIPQHLAGARPLDYLLTPPVRLPWELRVVMWNTKNVTAKKIYKHDDDCCCYDLCAPPNQSDIKLVCGMSGSKAPPQSSDVHDRSIDGEGNFNCRTIHEVMLPSPEALANLKVQVWNINWNPDDCIAEAIIPMWSFFEFARRNYEANKDNPDKWIYRIPKQWVPMKHPQNSDKGDVEISVELLPKDIASKSEFKAASCMEAFEPTLNAPTQLLQPPNRPDSSFPWYRLDKQIIFRCKYCWKKSRKYVYCLILTAITFFILIIVIKVKVIDGK